MYMIFSSFLILEDDRQFDTCIIYKFSCDFLEAAKPDKHVLAFIIVLFLFFIELNESKSLFN